jgi:histidyl-tRNA synthetase
MAARRDDAAATCAALAGLVGGSETGSEGVRELETIAELLDVRGTGRAIIDPSVVRGLGYYTGPVYEAELTFDVLDEKGRPRQFGSVAGGGRYDDLVRRFTGESVPATGISIGVDRLLAALAARSGAEATPPGPVIITAMDRERMAQYQAMAAELRAAGIRAEVFLGGGNMGRQLKYADQRNAPVAVIEGGDEEARGVVQLKDLALGARLAANIATREDWSSQPAQTEVPRAALVAEVRAMIARARA